jgi:hypothetical protein
MTIAIILTAAYIARPLVSQNNPLPKAYVATFLLLRGPSLSARRLLHKTTMTSVGEPLLKGFEQASIDWDRRDPLRTF